MNKIIASQRSKESGFTLLEVLIALLVLSIGLLGLAALQTVGLRSNQVATLRTQATHAVYDISDRMRANPPGLTQANAYYVIAISTAPAMTVNCDAAACAPAQTAAFDLVQWRAIVEQLPNGKSQITQTAVGSMVTHTITVHWNETRDPAVTGETCPPASNTDLRCIQLTL